MKLLRNAISLVSGLSLVAAIAMTPLSVSAAGSNVFSVSPNGGSYKAGSTFTVVISENSSTNDVDSARAELNYDQAKLSVVSFSTAGNPFTTCATPAGAASGNITTGDCTLLGGKKQGSQTLASVTFKALASSGSTSITFSNSSQLVNNGTDLAWSQATATYTFAAPVVVSGPAASTSAPAAKATTASVNRTAVASETTTSAPLEVTTAPVESETATTEAPKATTNNGQQATNFGRTVAWVVAGIGAALLVAGAAMYMNARRAAAASAAAAAASTKKTTSKSTAKKPVAKKPAAKRATKSRS